MNERIRELTQQAGISILYEYDGYDGHAGVCNLNDLEKFAELIVKECANRATWAQDTGEKDIGSEVLKHFGVEE